MLNETHLAEGCGAFPFRLRRINGTMPPESQMKGRGSRRIERASSSDHSRGVFGARRDGRLATLNCRLIIFPRADFAGPAEFPVNWQVPARVDGDLAGLDRRSDVPSPANYTSRANINENHCRGTASTAYLPSLEP